MIVLAALAAALSSQGAQDIRCVAVLGVVAYEQGRPGGRWADLAPVKSDGERFAGIVGERTMKETGQTREAVRDLILGDVAILQKAKDLAPAEVRSCLVRAAVVAPKPDIVRCAGGMAVAADRARKVEGQSPGAKDLATLASVLAYRARVEGAGKGRSEAQTADAIAAAIAAETRGGAALSDEDLADCATLAAAQ